MQKSMLFVPSHTFCFNEDHRLTVIKACHRFFTVSILREQNLTKLLLLVEEHRNTFRWDAIFMYFTCLVI
jgi:hypothetical protein